MTVVKQIRMLLDVGDVLQLRLICGYRTKEEKPCDGEMLYQFGSDQGQRSWQCPKCGELWKTQFPDNMPLEMRQVSPQEAASFALIAALETLAGPGCGLFTIRFEVDGKAEGKTG